MTGTPPDAAYYRRLDISIALELAVAQLYERVSATFEQHRDFFWRLYIEEQNHAALLKSLRETFAHVNVTATGLLDPDLLELQTTVDAIRTFTARLSVDPPPIGAIVRFALSLERGAGEEHYQHYMSVDPATPPHQIFQRLNGDDKDHASRLERLLGELEPGTTQP